MTADTPPSRQNLPRIFSFATGISSCCTARWSTAGSIFALAGPVPPWNIFLRKLLCIFRRLQPSTRTTVEFYDKLQKLSAGYLLPLMPFDTIKLSFNFEGLCPPGLSNLRYAETASALMEVLPCFLPTTIPDVHPTLTTVGSESNDGFDHLWRILESAVPGFDPTAPILPPVWHRDSNMFEFSQAHLLYFHLQAKKNNYFDARIRTTIFLRAISTSDYANIVTLLQI
jgi:hypothetical protein